MRLLLLGLLAGCLDEGAASELDCDPEVTLTAGSQQTLELVLQGGESRALCVLLDARSSASTVGFVASTPFFPTATALELRDATTVLTSDDATTGELHWEIAPHTRSAVTLTTTASPGVATLDVVLRLRFAAAQ